MGMGLSGGFAAGAGADALEELLKQAFAQQVERKRAAQEDQRIKIEQQRANDATELRKLDQEAAAQTRAANQQAQAQTGAIKLRGQLRPKQEVSPEQIATLTKGGFGEDVTPATLSSRNIGQNMTSTPNPGHGPSFTGTPDQLDEQAQGAELDRQIAMASPQLRGRLSMAKLLPADKRSTAISEVMKEEAKPPTHSAAYNEYQDAVASGYKGDFNKYQTEDANRKKSAPALITVQTIDANGNAVTRVVPKVAGTEVAKAPDATTANRLVSAKGVVKTGNDIISTLRDPAVAAQLGPVMSRYNSVADFVGNPPPEFAKLAGQIESFSLANMGVHGMRSNTGAEAIKQTIGLKRHTPQSIIATIEGLNGFANHILEDNHQSATEPKAAGGSSTPTTETPEARLKRLMGGG